MGLALDSTLFIDAARGRVAALRKMDELEKRTEVKVIPTPVAYEVLTGLVKAGSKTQIVRFRAHLARFHVAALDLDAAEKAAVLRAELEALGRAKGTGDLLTAGIALAGGHTLVTRDRDFHEIAEATGLLLETY